MSLPTLLLKGNLQETGYNEKKEILDEYRPIDYIVKWFDSRIQKSTTSPIPVAKSIADKILLVRSSTGSGKSTVMPSELFHVYFKRTRRSIACTQPRVFNAIDIPTTQIIPYNTKEKLKSAGYSDRDPLVLEENIGYQTKAFIKKPPKGLVFMTIGVLAQQIKIMKPEDFMNKYSIIIIDEAHEQSVDATLLLFRLKKFISENYKNENCPFLVITSATFDVFKFCDYMLSEIPKSVRYQNIVDVLGFSHPITDNFFEYSSSDFLLDAAKKAVELHKNDDLNEKFKDILIFVSGVSEIKKISMLIEKEFSNQKQTKPKNNKSEKNDVENSEDKEKSEKNGGCECEYIGGDKTLGDVIIIPITRNEIQNETINFQYLTMDYNEIPGKPKRRIMIATNVGETGITYPNLKYVIDTGFYNSLEYDPNRDAEILITKPVTKAMYRQRRGRSGRNAPGMAYAIYTKETYEKMLDDSYPEIVKEDITTQILELLCELKDDKSSKKSQINLFGDFDLLDKPSFDSWCNSIEKLFNLGLITDKKVTDYGILVNSLTKTIPLESLCMVLSGFAWEFCIADLIALASALEESDLFNRKESDKFNKALANGDFNFKCVSKTGNLLLMDDFVLLLMIFNLYKDNDSDWFADRGINVDALGRVVNTYDETCEVLAANGWNPIKFYNKSIYNLMNENCELSEVTAYMEKLKICIREGYKVKTAKYVNGFYITNKYVKLTINKPYCGINSSPDKSSENPLNIMYHKLRYVKSNDASISLYEPTIDYLSIN